jgi:hypothetical protein
MLKRVNACYADYLQALYRMLVLDNPSASLVCYIYN